MAQALDQVTYPVNGSGEDGLGKSTQAGHSFGRRQAGVLAGPCLSASLTCSSTRASLVWRVRFMMLPHFFIWLKAFLGKGWFLGHADGTGKVKIFSGCKQMRDKPSVASMNLKSFPSGVLCFLCSCSEASLICA